jgi:hypothetical protein
VDSIAAFLQTLTDEQLDHELDRAINAEWSRRIETRLTPGTVVRTITSGFSGGPGVCCVFQGWSVPGQDSYIDRYAKFGSRVDGETRWLCDPEALGSTIRIVREADRG